MTCTRRLMVRSGGMKQSEIAWMHTNTVYWRNIKCWITTQLFFFCCCLQKALFIPFMHICIVLKKKKTSVILWACSVACICEVKHYFHWQTQQEQLSCLYGNPEFLGFWCVYLQFKLWLEAKESFPPRWKTLWEPFCLTKTNQIR